MSHVLDIGYVTAHEISNVTENVQEISSVIVLQMYNMKCKISDAAGYV